MSAKTRINRPTTATPRKMPVRVVHQSTNHTMVKTPTGLQTIRTKGNTYRKAQG